jgi:hypothetical protein
MEGTDETPQAISSVLPLSPPFVSEPPAADPLAQPPLPEVHMGIEHSPALPFSLDVGDLSQVKENFKHVLVALEQFSQSQSLVQQAIARTQSSQETLVLQVDAMFKQVIAAIDARAPVPIDPVVAMQPTETHSVDMDQSAGQPSQSRVFPHVTRNLDAVFAASDDSDVFKSVKLPELPTFDGSKDPIDWFDNVEFHLAAACQGQITSGRLDKALPRLYLAMHGQARTWALNFIKSTPANLQTYTKFRSELCQFFRKADREETALAKFHSATQLESVQKFGLYLKKLALDIPSLDDTQLYDRLKFGAEPEVRKELQLECYRRKVVRIPFEEALLFLDGIERAGRVPSSSGPRKEYGPTTGNPKPTGGSPNPKPTPGPPKPTPKPTPKPNSPNTPSVECRKCGKIGHKASECKARWTADGKPICETCHKVGHKTKECPTSTKGKGNGSGN